FFFEQEINIAPDLFRSYTFVLDVQCVLLHKQKNKTRKIKYQPQKYSVKHHVMDMFSYHQKHISHIQYRNNSSYNQGYCSLLSVIRETIKHDTNHKNER